MNKVSLKKHTDSELLELLKINNESAFAELYNRYWKKILTVAIHKTSDIVEAENIVQDIFHSLWQRRNELQIHTRLDNYLMVSTKYRVIKFLNRQRQQRLFEESGLLNLDILDDTTQEYLAFEELKARLELFVSQLPEICQLVYRLNRDEGKSYREIANIVGITEKSVDGHLNRAKKTLRSRLDTDLNSFLL